MVFNGNCNTSDRYIVAIASSPGFYCVFISICSLVLIFQSAGLALAIEIPLYAGNPLLYESGTMDFYWNQDDIYEVQNNNGNSIYLIFLVNSSTYRVLTRTANGTQIQGTVTYYPGAIQTEPKDYTNSPYKTNVFLGYTSAGTSFYIGVPYGEQKIFFYTFQNGYNGGNVTRFQARWWTESYGLSSYLIVTPPSPLNLLRLPNVNWTTPSQQTFTLGYRICAVEIPPGSRLKFSIAFGNDYQLIKIIANLGWVTTTGGTYWTISYNNENKFLKVRPFFLGVANASGNVRIFFNNTELSSIKYLDLTSTNFVTKENDIYELLQLDPQPEPIATAPVSNIPTDTVYSTDSIFSFITNFQDKIKTFFNLLLEPLRKFREVKQ